jgi:hypothetical protein
LKMISSVRWRRQLRKEVARSRADFKGKRVNVTNINSEHFCKCHNVPPEQQ